ncbi:MAG TPA: hypothetical protein DDY43_09340 [Synechococcales bacterium UBA10510]|nr:hypothetical protein [Synechococcales bacterium UBA10510]
MNVFLTHLAVEGQVSASSQNQALAALLFLYRELLEGAHGARRQGRQGPDDAAAAKPGGWVARPSSAGANCSSDRYGGWLASIRVSCHTFRHS